MRSLNLTTRAKYKIITNLARGKVAFVIIKKIPATTRQKWPSTFCSPLIIFVQFCLCIFVSTTSFSRGLSGSIPLLSVSLKLILILVFACSFLCSLSEPALFSCWIVKQTRMLLIPAQAHPQHLFCIWQIWEHKFLGEKMMVVWWFKFKLFTRILPLSFDPNHPITPSLSSLPPELPFPPPLLFSAGWSPNKVTSSCIVGEIVKFSLSPCGSDLAIISSNCDCNTGTDWNRLASYFSSGSLWAYLNI